MKLKTILITIGLWVASLLTVFFITKVRYPKINTVIKEVPYQVPVKIYSDSSGYLHSVISSLEMERNSYKSTLDSLAQVLKVKSKDISSVSNITTETNLDVSGEPIIQKDSSVYTFSKKDNYLSLSGEVSPSRYNIHLSLVDTITTISYRKNHLFKADETFLDISNSNPYVKVNKGRSVIIKERKPFATIGPYLGYEIFPKQHLSFGISVQKPIFYIR